MNKEVKWEIEEAPVVRAISLSRLPLLRVCKQIPVSHPVRNADDAILQWKKAGARDADGGVVDDEEEEEDTAIAAVRDPAPSSLPHIIVSLALLSLLPLNKYLYSD